MCIKCYMSDQVLANCEPCQKRITSCRTLVRNFMSQLIAYSIRAVIFMIKGCFINKKKKFCNHFFFYIKRTTNNRREKRENEKSGVTLKLFETKQFLLS